MNFSDPVRLQSAVALALAFLLIVTVPASVGRPGAGPATSVEGGPPAGTALPADAGSVAVAPGYAVPAGAATQGPLSSDAAVGVAVGLASRDPSGLAAYVAAEETAGTPQYRHPLSATEAAARFGATPRALSAAEQYFGRFGLRAVASPDGLLVYVDGASGQVARAFGTTFESYRLADGRAVYSHPTPAVLPAGVAPWSGAYGLGNVTAIVPAVHGTPVAPEASTAAGCSSSGGELLPCSIETAYNMTTLLGHGIDGAGERIAVVDAYDGSEPQTTLESDLAGFAGRAGVSVGTVHYLYPVPSTGPLNSSSTNPGWGLEEALDLEWARAIAPGATIDMTFSPNAGAGLYAAIDWLVARDAADVISLSWGEPDVGIYNAVSGPCSSACNASSDGSYEVLGPVLELAAAEGIGVFAASGDCGAADGTSGVATNFPADDPYVTGVGGTVLTLSGSDWAGETAWSGNESGASGSGCTNGGGSGGGYSNLPRPWWQTGLPVGSVGRGVPDVSMDAATPVLIEYQGGTGGVEGTSVGTPIWAGIGAIADQYAHQDLGLLDPGLYKILGSDRYASDFHDITSGSNGYKARVGWDPVTGIGTPVVDALVEDLVRGGALAGDGLATSLSADPRSGAAPLAVDFTVSASGGTGTYPLEGISFGDTNSSLTRTGEATYTYGRAGVYAAQSFVADSSGNASVSAPVPIVVGGGSPLEVTLHASTTAPENCSEVNFTASVSDGSPPYSFNFWFGDGSSSNGGSAATAGHRYTTPGEFEAEAWVSDSASPVDGGASAPIEISVSSASAQACGSTGRPLAVTPELHPAVRDAPADFPNLFTVSGGGTGAGRPAPTITLSSSDPYVAACECTIFRDPGNYTVSEQAVNSTGASANASTEVTVAPPLAASFAASAMAGPVPLAVEFTATVSGGYRVAASATAWTFGVAGATAEGAEANYTFVSPGEYLVTGRVGDAGQGNASESFLIDAEPATGAPPLGATATISPSASVPLGTTVRFHASVIGATAPTPLLWDLGPGYRAEGPYANQTYFAEPTGDALALGLVLEGADWIPLETIPLSLPGFVALETDGFAPAADALSLVGNVTPYLGPAPFAVDALGAALGPGGATITWQFGTGGPLTGTTAAYTFTVPGNYTVSARAIDPYGDAAVVSQAVAVTPALSVTGGPSPQSGAAPLHVDYAVAASGGDGPPYTYAWQFGNGANATVASGSVTFAHPGSYRVTLEVTDRTGDLIERNWTVTVRLPATVPLAVLAAGAGAGIVLAVVLGLRLGRRRRTGP